jgi:hypothetical protein
MFIRKAETRVAGRPLYLPRPASLDSLRDVHPAKRHWSSPPSINSSTFEATGNDFRCILLDFGTYNLDVIAQPPVLIPSTWDDDGTERSMAGNLEYTRSDIWQALSDRYRRTYAYIRVSPAAQVSLVHRPLAVKHAAISVRLRFETRRADGGFSTTMSERKISRAIKSASP